jgi:CheY-like chemotaxis protein
MSAAAADGGENALKTLTDAVMAGAPFHVALVDGDMPNMSGFELASIVKSRKEIRDTALMILVTVEANVDSAQLREMGFAGYMTKPVRQSQLFNAIMEALASSRAFAPAPQPTAAWAASADADQRTPAPRIAGRTIRVLLAEDNRVNQIVAGEILSRAGCEYDVAVTGREAVDKALTGRYDLILMDCQMPELDGIDATREIRRWEAQEDADRVPIIALTANAMKGDREQCLEAGMDAFESKPISAARLIAAIRSLLKPRILEEGALQAENRDAQAALSPTTSAAPIDVGALLERCMGNAEIAVMFLDEFEKQLATDLQSIESSIPANDVEAVARTAHGLKGASAVAAASSLHAASLALEASSKAGELLAMASDFDQLKMEAARCVRFIPAARSSLTQASGMNSRTTSNPAKGS